MLDRVPVYLRTVRRLRPGMLVARLRGKRCVHRRDLTEKHPMRFVEIAVPVLDLDPSYLERFDAEALLEGEFLLINERHRPDLSAWNAPKASHLWNFNLHYFEWGVALAACWHRTGDVRMLVGFKRLVNSWMDGCPYARGDAWHPYTISLRLVNWLICMDLFGGELQRDETFFNRMRESMYWQYRHLACNRELHLRANHYWENVKTLVIFAAVFGDQPGFDRALREFAEQLDEQILPDGVHFERSLMYHKLVLEGMLRVRLVAEELEFDLPSSFVRKLQLMLDAMASLERGMGKTPFFNDAADGVAKDCATLVKACSRLLGFLPDDTKTKFPDAGYYKLYDGDITVMFDAGESGPSYMLGHAHCDCLSFELSLAGKPVVVNAGTYAYQSELRSYFRGTSAHNTAQVDGVEQLECWGEHRVGWSYRLHDVQLAVGGSELEASIELPGGSSLRRRVKLRDGVLRVEDVAGEASSKVVSRIHAECPQDLRIEVERGDVRISASPHSPRFGVVFDIPVYEITGRGSVAYALHMKGGTE